MLRNNFQKILKKIKSISNKKWEQVIFLLSSVLIIFLTTIIPINSDEYLYSAIGNNFVAAFHGQACFNCIDTYHTFFTSIIIALSNIFTGIDSIIFYRVIISLFSIGTIFLLYELFKEIFKDSEYLPLLLIFLFPGFFYFGCMVMLDNVVFFFFTLLIYLLVKKKSYWKIGVVMFLIFISKEYYIIFGIFVVMVTIFYDMLIVSREKTWIWKLNFFLKKIIESFLFVGIALVSILFFRFFPYPGLLGSLMLELFGRSYEIVGKILNKIIYPNIHHSKLYFSSGHPLSIYESIQDSFSRNLQVVVKSKQSFFVHYFKYTFNEVYLNLYAFPLFFYGFFIWFCKKKKQFGRNSIIIFSIAISFFLFWICTARLGVNDFRFVFIFIIPIMFFSILAIKDLLEIKKIKPRHYIFVCLSLIYIILCLLDIQRTTSSSFLYGSLFGQIFLKFKFIFNMIFYAFPVIIIFLRIKIDTKKLILVGWLILAFSYKIAPEVLNTYLVDKKSNTEYNLNYAKKDLHEIEKDIPNVLTNYERAYYYYSESSNMPNDIRKKLPIIRPKPYEIHKKRVFSFKENDVYKINQEYLCNKKINYIFYVNKNINNVKLIKKIKDIKGIKTKDNFYKEGKLNWALYKFNNKYCK